MLTLLAVLRRLNCAFAYGESVRIRVLEEGSGHKLP